MPEQDEAHASGRGRISQQDLEGLKGRLDRLDADLDDARDHSRLPKSDGRSGAIGKAFRMATDLVAAVLVGAAIGWSIDRWAGWDKPWCLIVFTMLGFAAGMRNMIRTAQRMQAAAVARHGIGVDLADDVDEDGPDARS